ncbi:12680_t:CDS:2, partial [Funneliformis geosporum]
GGVTPKTFKGFVENTLLIETEEFLKIISYYKTYMAKYNGNDMKRIPPELKD